jgi:hypothetical protein
VASNRSGNDDGSIRREVLECMTWAETGILWTVSGGIPKSLNLLGSANTGSIASVRFGPSLGAFIFAFVALLTAVRPDPATAVDRGAIAIQAQTSCIVGHRFEPGPIVGGHNRQPTVPEFQERMAQLREFEQRGADRCAGASASTG